MNRLASKATAKTYKHGLKPLLFLQKPDIVHSRMLKSGAFFQKMPAVKTVVESMWSYEANAYLGQTLHGISFRNPVGLSAGFDKNFELVPMLKSVGFGFMEGGSLTYLPCEGNERPWFHRLPKSKSLVVHVGLANQGVEAILARVATYPHSIYDNFPLNISVAKTNSPVSCTDEGAIEDYVGSLKAIKASKLGQMVTINISCPNTYGGEPFTTPKRLEKLLAAVDKVQLKQPVFVKMPCLASWSEARALIDVIATHKIAGLTMSNLIKDRSNLKLKDPLPDSIQGGLSGKPTWDTSNMLIRRTYRNYGGRFTIIGVGGIFSAEDAYTKIRLGASLVELITGMIFEGPQLIGEINRDLVKLLKRDGFTNISQAIGIDAIPKA